MPKAILAMTYIDKRVCSQEFLYTCLVLIFNSSNLRMTILQGKNQFKVAKYYHSYKAFFSRSIQTHG